MLSAQGGKKEDANSQNKIDSILKSLNEPLSSTYKTKMKLRIGGSGASTASKAPSKAPEANDSVPEDTDDAAAQTQSLNLPLPMNPNYKLLDILEEFKLMDKEGSKDPPPSSGAFKGNSAEAKVSGLAEPPDVLLRMINRKLNRTVFPLRVALNFSLAPSHILFSRRPTRIHYSALLPIFLADKHRDRLRADERLSEGVAGACAAMCCAVCLVTLPPPHPPRRSSCCQVMPFPQRLSCYSRPRRLVLAGPLWVWTSWAACRLRWTWARQGP